MLYWIRAEHMTAQLLEKVVHSIENQQLGNVYAYGMDSVFTGFANVVVDTDSDSADEIRAMIHKQNGGAYCNARETNEEELEEHL